MTILANDVGSASCIKVWPACHWPPPISDAAIQSPALRGSSPTAMYHSATPTIAQAMDCLRLARVHAADLSLVLRCTAQSANMMRQARGARSLLLRVQAARQKREANNTATDKAAWIEHCAIGLMADALGRAPPAPLAEPPPELETDDAFALLTEAEQYAVIYPRRAALIRSCGDLPVSCDFGPPPPELVAAIVTGTGPTLRALDVQAAA